MTTEEKAQRYDEVSKEVKDYFDGKLMMYSDVKQTLNYLFPELAESEDEKIRKWILEIITQIPNASIEWDVINKTDVLTWLEKKIAGQFEGITDDEKYQQGWHDALEKAYEWLDNNFRVSSFDSTKIVTDFSNMYDLKDSFKKAMKKK